MSDNWDSIKGFEGWADKLNELLEDATTAIVKKDAMVMAKVQKRLLLFYDKSPDEFSRKLDEIAEEAILNIHNESLEQALQAIAHRSNDLVKYTKDIRSITSGATRSASLISLESPQAIVKSLTDIIASAKQIKDVIATDANSEEIDKRITSMVNAIKKLRDIIENT